MIFTDTVSESSYFELLGDGKYGLFLNLKVDGKIIFSGYWKILVLGLEVLVLNILKMGNLLGLFALSMIFQGLGNMVSCTVGLLELLKKIGLIS